MIKVRNSFSLLEVVLVALLAAVAMSIIIPAFSDRSPGQIKIEMTDTLNKIFSSAAIRSQSFGRQVKVTFKYEPESPLVCRLENEVLNPELPVIDPESMTEDQVMARQDSLRNERIWGGEDSHQLPDEVILTDFEDIISEENEIVFRFFPDGEATGPIMNLTIENLKFRVTVDRLKGQLVLFEVEEL